MGVGGGGPAGFQPMSAVELGIIPRRAGGVSGEGGGEEGRVRGVAALEAMPSGADILSDAILEESILLQQERELARLLGGARQGSGGKGSEVRVPLPLELEEEEEHTPRGPKGA